jgi:hypothetical protein
MSGKSVITGQKIQREVLETSQFHMNVKQGFVLTTEDKIRICLMRYLDGFAKSQAWITPLSLCLTIGVALLTADFKSFVLPKETWQACFFIALGLSFVWFLYSLRHLRGTPTIDDVVREIREGSIPTDES